MKFSATTLGFYPDDTSAYADPPADLVDISDELYAEMLNAPNEGKTVAAGPDGLPVLVEPPAATLDQTAAHMVGVVQAWMDDAARAKGYDSLLTAISYAEEPAVASFQADGRAFRAWRSRVWAKCHTLLDEVNAGTRAVPTESELIALLPARGA